MDLDLWTRRLESPKRLSVLIPTLHTRLDPLRRLLREIERQVGDRSDVEVIALLDMKTRFLGDKRNELMALARGDYLSFVNDDDMIAPVWLERVMHHLDANPGVDVLSLCAECMKRDAPGAEWRHEWYMKTSLRATHDSSGFYYPDPSGLWVDSEGERSTRFVLHKPVMWCVWRTEVARRADFPPLNYGEDMGWARKVAKLAHSEAAVNEILYRYFADDSTSEAGPWAFQAPEFKWGGIEKVYGTAQFTDHFRPDREVAA